MLITIKHLGNTPCPGCLVQKNEIHELGMKHNQNQCKRLAQKDDQACKWNVETAHKLLFEKGLCPGSKYISNILEAKLLTPNQVCRHVPIGIVHCWWLSTEHIFWTAWTTWGWCLLIICCWSSAWVRVGHLEGNVTYHTSSPSIVPFRLLSFVLLSPSHCSLSLVPYPLFLVYCSLFHCPFLIVPLSHCPLFHCPLSFVPFS